MTERVYRQFVECELCGEKVCKIGWKQRRCKKCVPSKAAYQRAVRYVLSQPAFETMLKRQDNRCALCKTELHNEHINGLHVDHDHETGKVRGLLCGECNHGVGHIERLVQSNGLERVMTYLRGEQ